jgi:nitrate reductase alpha subunit
MSHFLDRLTHFNLPKESFSGTHGVTTGEDRTWEDAYRNRWAHDKIVRSTHGVNCTGSCSWKIYVKGGIVTWETQQTDYPRTRWDMPNHEPRGCARGASYSWYLYSANRVKYPMVRGRLLERWRAALKVAKTPVDAWATIVEDDAARRDYQKLRGMGGFVRSSWDEVNTLIAAANVYTIKKHGADRVIGFSPIPAMSMVSYAAGSRYLSLIGGVCMSFYDWYCDLPPASPQVWGEQTDVPESADWYNSTYIIAWGSNVPQTRTPDAHFFTEVRYKGAKTVAVTPDYSEVAKLADLWMHPKQGTDAALAMAMGHVALNEFYFKTAQRLLRRLRTPLHRPAALGDAQGAHAARRPQDPGARPLCARQRLSTASWARTTTPSGRRWPLTQEAAPCCPTAASASAGAPRAAPTRASGTWKTRKPATAKRSSSSCRSSRMACKRTKSWTWACPTSVASARRTSSPTRSRATSTTSRCRPCACAWRWTGKSSNCWWPRCLTCRWRKYGIDRGLGSGAKSYDDDAAYTPAWAESITGVPRDQIITVGRQFADNAHKTHGKSMIIIGAAMNHWYHADMNYRGVINLLMMCGCIGQSGGGWAHYVGQEKLRPQTGWTALAFALDWIRPPRQMNSTSFFYAHTDQWRYEKLGMEEIVSPTLSDADKARFAGSMIDYNVRAERMGWLPSAPQLKTNPMQVVRDATAAGMDAKDYAVRALKDGTLQMSCEDPDAPQNWPRNLFVWRSNLLGSSGKGHEYFCKHLLGTENGVQGKDLGKDEAKPEEVKWHEHAPVKASWTWW